MTAARGADRGKPGDWRHNEHHAFLNQPNPMHAKVTYRTGPRDPNTGWRDCANCHPGNADLFDAPASGRARSGLSIRAADITRYRQAAALCATCPVQAQCRADPNTQRSEGFRHGELWLRVYGKTRLKRHDPFTPTHTCRRNGCCTDATKVPEVLPVLTPEQLFVEVQGFIWADLVEAVAAEVSDESQRQTEVSDETQYQTPRSGGAA